MLFPTLAVLALLGALPPQDPGPRVASLAAQLDDDSSAVRERATAELLKLGKAAAPDLRIARDETPSAETKARIEQVLKELDKPKRNEGGATVRGLSATLRVKSAKSTFLVLEVEFSNRDDEARPFCPINLFDKTLPHQSFVTNAAEAKIEMTQRSGERPKDKRRAVC